MIKKIYFDMDGVLSDFDGGALKLAGTKTFHQQGGPNDDAMWDKIREVDHFYYKLEPLDKDFTKFKEVEKKYPGKVAILTGIPKPRRNIKYSAEDKRAWIKKYLGDLEVNTVYKADKKNFALGKDYVLIDDYHKNIEEWEEAGGLGILYNENIDIIKELEEIEKKL